MSVERPGSGPGCAAISSKLPHALVIAVLFLGLTSIYYADRIIGSDVFGLGDTFLTGVHDIHRTFFLIPIVYAALVFRIMGAAIAGLAFLVIILPRALLLSPFPDPLLRGLISVASSAAVGFLVAGWRNRLDAERTARQILKENQVMLIQSEKLASMGQLAASIAHEVNNPLSGILVYIRLMRKKIAKGEIEREVLLDYLSKIDHELTRSTRLIRNLLDFSSQSLPVMKEVDVADVIDRSLDLAAHASNGKVTVQKKLSQLPRIVTDPDQLQAVLMNLIINGFQAMPEGGTLTVMTELGEGEIKIVVRDTGYGIPPENMTRIFTPFFSTKKDVKGVGLGLSVSYGIVQRLKGKMEVESRVNHGTTFTVSLPLVQPRIQD